MVATKARTPRMLLVEDDVALSDALGSALRNDGYAVRHECDGSGISRAVASFRPDVVILDAQFPHGPSGFSIARLLRDDPELPIIFLTAADASEDRLAGFDAGADDCVSTPFVMAELLAPVRALLRRSGKMSPDTWQVGDLVVDTAARRVHRNGCIVELTRIEFNLLVELGRNPDTVLSKTQLLLQVWGSEFNDVNLVEVHISALRRKLEEHGPRLIHTVRGFGYRLRPPTD
jgi:two-component system, OmpR family, response regulator